MTSELDLVPTDLANGGIDDSLSEQLLDESQADLSDPSHLPHKLLLWATFAGFPLVDFRATFAGFPCVVYWGQPLLDFPLIFQGQPLLDIPLCTRRSERVQNQNLTERIYFWSGDKINISQLTKIMKTISAFSICINWDEIGKGFMQTQAISSPGYARARHHLNARLDAHNTAGVQE